MRENFNPLCKELCKRCHSEDTSALKIEWDSYDDEWWNKRDVYCPFDYIHDDDEGEIPPTNCPYRLEHMMATQRKPIAGEVGYI